MAVKPVDNTQISGVNFHAALSKDGHTFAGWQVISSQALQALRQSGALPASYLASTLDKNNEPGLA